MKHLGASEVQLAAAGVGLSLSEEKSELIAAQAVWLMEISDRLNLTAITSPAEVLRLHVADSLAAAPEFCQAPAGPAIDIGTGGGYPGFPLSVACDREVVLMDSAKKKTLALQSFLDRVDWDLATTCSDRAEEHAVAHRGEYAVVTARAVAPLSSLLELASPLLCEGGWFIALKARVTDEELDSARGAGEMTGMSEVSVRSFGLPGAGESRTILVYRRTGEPSVPLPRRVGRAQSKPLA